MLIPTRIKFIKRGKSSDYINLESFSHSMRLFVLIKPIEQQKITSNKKITMFKNRVLK